MNKLLNSLKILRGLNDEKIVTALFEYHAVKDLYSYNDLVYEIYSAHAEDNLKAYFCKLILTDENAFSIGCATQSGVSDYVKKAYFADLKLVLNLLTTVENKGDYNSGEFLPPFDSLDEMKTVETLTDFYKAKGYGKFIFNRAFKYEDGEIIPIDHPSEISLSQLKNYETEKLAVMNNVNDFLCGLPYRHMLLYGDRGTGKSSTVHALLNELYERGLRLIEVGKESLAQINRIKQTVYGLPLKFIIFIDDLSVDEQDGILPSLKASVEGSINAGANAMIVATSNRRHVIKESFTDRENSVHPSDSIEEQLSLSDRFGLTVLFSSTDREEYLSIVSQLAKDLNITISAQELNTLAERWAIIKGGRSPRRAKQFVDFLYSCEKVGRKIEF